jgi:prephenate dehydrogenase
MSRAVEVIGLGLMGASLAWRLADAGWTVYGCDPDPDALAWAADHDIRPGPAARPDWIVIAVPIPAVPGVVDAVARRAHPGLLVTDLASVKGPVLEALARLPAEVRVVSSHPMAGNEGQGHRMARQDMYQGRIWAAVPVPGRPAPWAELEELVRPTGAVLTRLTADEHDRLAAYTSHLPYLVAMMLSHVVAMGPPGVERLVGPGLLSATRTAGSPPALWRDILDANRSNVVAALARFEEEVTRWKAILATASPDALAEHLDTIRTSRDRWLTPSD